MSRRYKSRSNVEMKEIAHMISNDFVQKAARYKPMPRCTVENSIRLVVSFTFNISNAHFLLGES